MMQNDAFLRVSADTKTWAACLNSCGSPLNPVPTGGSLRQAQDRLRLPTGKHKDILTEFQTKDNKKMKKKCFIST